jgi:hypothetical protein
MGQGSPTITMTVAGDQVEVDKLLGAQLTMRSAIVACIYAQHQYTTFDSVSLCELNPEELDYFLRLGPPPRHCNSPTS